jgi:ATP adenylyltransferase
MTDQGSAALEGAEGLAGTPDGFERLWVPHRMVYIGGDHGPGKGGECPFCAAPGRDDAESLIVARGRTVFALLNLYPYNSGHLLVCPYRHVADLTELTPDEAAELTAFTQQAMRALRAARSPQGFNLGVNQGQLAGAGIAAHLHQHVVPRWTGDSNFFPIVAQTRALPELLGAMRQDLAAAWAGLDPA